MAGGMGITGASLRCCIGRLLSSYLMEWHDREFIWYHGFCSHHSSIVFILWREWYWRYVLKPMLRFHCNRLHFVNSIFRAGVDRFRQRASIDLSTLYNALTQMQKAPKHSHASYYASPGSIGNISLLPTRQKGDHLCHQIFDTRILEFISFRPRYLHISPAHRRSNTCPVPPWNKLSFIALFGSIDASLKRIINNVAHGSISADCHDFSRSILLISKWYTLGQMPALKWYQNVRLQRFHCESDSLAAT
jgi:hypothetical protein